MKPLGRRIPTTWEHLARYPLSAAELPIPPAGTERSLGLPWWWKQADQGNEGSCVGWGCSHMMSITNHRQRLLETGRDITYRYDAPWLYHEAQLVDEWIATPPEEGTSVRAGCDILRLRGHRRVQGGISGPENLQSGISANRWAQTVDEVRAALYSDMAVAIGINWYASMDVPFQKIPGGDYWIDIAPHSKIRGGHCIALFRMSDSRQAFRAMNSWGSAFPPVWIGYDTIQRLIQEQGEFVVATDR